jgi:hypothetical protein
VIDPRSPASAVFAAPDGGVYVDRDGPRGDTLQRWRERFDPVTVRRRARRAAWRWAVLGVATVALVAALASGIGFLVLGSSIRVVAFTGVGVVVGIWSCIGFGLREPRVADAPVVGVPAEVLAAAPADASAGDVWRWSVAVRAEEVHRATIGYETAVERPGDQVRADQARDRYAAEYRAYDAAARELRIPTREPAITLDTGRRSAA